MVNNLEDMIVDMVAYECDYPHSDTVWPNVPEYLWASVNGLDKGTIDKITHLNVMREYSFDAFALNGGREKCTVGHLRELGKDVDVSPRHNLRSEEHTCELQSLMRLSYAVFCLKKKHK